MVARSKRAEGTPYSKEYDSKGNPYWHIDTEKDIFKGISSNSEIEKEAFDYILGKRDNKVVIDTIDGKKMSFIRLSAEEFVYGDDSKELKAGNPVMFAQKMRLIPSLEDLASNANVSWWSPDHKNHKLFKERGFENYRGRVGIDNVIFNFVIRAGKAQFGDVFYDINLEVDQILPHTKGASEIKESTSKHNIPSSAENVKNNFVDDTTGENVRFSIRKEDPPKKTIKGYKVFVVKNGKLYPPMVANPNGADTPVGVWLNADIGERAPDSKTGRKQVKAGGKGTQGGSGSLAFRPGWHLGETPLATQFDRLNPKTGKKELFPANFVWAECDIAADVDYQEEAMSYGYNKNGKFQHALAGLPKLPENGYYHRST